MARNDEPKTVRLTDSRGNTVVVESDKADRLLAGSGYTKASSRQSAKADDK